MKHYWINIEGCVERRKFMEGQFDKLGIDNERISAVTPEDIKDYKIEYNPDTKATQYEVACIISHLRALEKGVEEGHQYFCVMEDDINMSKLDFKKILMYVRDAEEIEGMKMEIMQMHTNSNVLIIKAVNEHVMNKQFVVKRTEGYPSTAYYMITREGAQKLLDKFKICETEYDLSYSHWTAADNVLYSPINCFFLSYPVITTDIGYGSIIHPSHLHHHEDSNVVIRDIHKRFNLMDLFV